MWFLLACFTPSPPPPPVEVPVPELEELPPPSEPRYAGSHILIPFAGCMNDGGTPRTEAEAYTLAESIRARAPTGDFTALAEAHSSASNAYEGGRIGTFRVGTLPPTVERAIAAAAPGTIGPLARSPFGFHVVRRDAIEEITLAHVLVAHHDATIPAKRTREEAAKRIQALHAELLAGADFATVARASSDDPSSVQGGDLGLTTRGDFMPYFERPAFALKVGETSAVVEGPSGFHIIRRTR